MVTNLDMQLLAHGGAVLTGGRACRSATVDQWRAQFRRAFAIQLTLCRYLHPSKRKRTRLRKRPECALTFKVSTVLADMRKVERMIQLIKGLVAVVWAQMRYRETRVA